MVGTGILNFAHCRGDNHIDLIPVDIVTNSIIITAAHAARQNGCLHVYQSGTSTNNPITMDEYREHFLRYFKYFSFNKKAFHVRIEYVRSKFEYEIKTKLFEEIPIKFYEMAAKLPYFGSKKL